MTEVEFHTGVADPVQFACILLRRAARQGVRVQITAPPETLAALDRALWTFEERDFVPHVRMPGAPPAVAQRTLLWLCSQALASDAPPVLVNLGGPAPLDPSQLERLIEIVGTDADEAAGGRQRWRDYKNAGLSPRHIDGTNTARG